VHYEAGGGGASVQLHLRSKKHIHIELYPLVADYDLQCLKMSLLRYEHSSKSFTNSKTK